MINIEQIEHVLHGLHQQPAVIVRPWFGSVSESSVGILSTVANVCPMKFSVEGVVAFVFTSEDVDHIEMVKDPMEHAPVVIIRLKGPHQYAEPFQSVS